MHQSIIQAKKEEILSIFDNFWFSIPEYQRSYVWDTDNVSDLLDDLYFAYENRNQDEYFLGSPVLRDLENPSYREYEVLDGQQRLTTLMLLISVIRDLAVDPQLKANYREMIYQERNVFRNIPERLRMVYKIRDDVSTFIDAYVKTDGGTTNHKGLANEQLKPNISISNMANAILVMVDFFKDKSEDDIVGFAMFLNMKVVFIYVSTNNREDAFRLFTILNNRGVPLTNADILKSINIGEIKEKKENEVYARHWEALESGLGDNLDRFLSFIRTVLIKEKARVNLLEEFEELIYKKGLLDKGKPTIDLMKRYKKHYDDLLHFEVKGLENEYKNLITIMQIGLASDDWVPPLLFYYDKFGQNEILRFLKQLEFKFFGDWIIQKSPTERIENMTRILKEIDRAGQPNLVLDNSSLFEVNLRVLREILAGDLYGRKFARYIMLKYEFLISDHTVHLSDYSNISLEHVLPQKPSADSQWKKDFTDQEHEYWKDKLANLVLISKRKNSKLSNKDFVEKRERYLKERIDAFHGSKVFIMQKDKWNPDVLEERQRDMLNKLLTI